MLDKFLIIYIEAFKGKNIKFTIPEAGEKLRNDLNSVIEFFSKSKSQKRIKSSFDCIDRLISLIEANQRLIYIDFFSLYKSFPDVNIDFIEKLLGKRSDMEKSQIKEIMEGIKSKVQEDTNHPKYKEVQTIFSKVNYKI